MAFEVQREKQLGFARL